MICDLHLDFGSNYVFSVPSHHPFDLFAGHRLFSVVSKNGGFLLAMVSDAEPYLPFKLVVLGQNTF